MLKFSSENIRNKGNHNQSAQIADTCLADFESLEIKFKDLVSEINRSEVDAATERLAAAMRRQKSLDCLERLNNKLECDLEAEETEPEEEKPP